MISALEGLKSLREGNLRFVNGHGGRGEPVDRARRRELVSGQAPFAIILGCSDSRVPPELVFDQGLGDLFVVRVAGNIAAPSQLGSVEFAAGQLGARLVVVLGHSRCSAVLATLSEIENPSPNPSENLLAIVDRIRPSVAPLLLSDGEAHRDGDSPVRDAVRANVRAAANHLRRGSPILERLIREDDLIVVGAEYSLETGVVDFFDGPLEAV